MALGTAAAQTVTGNSDASYPAITSDISGGYIPESITRRLLESNSWPCVRLAVSCRASSRVISRFDSAMMLTKSASSSLIILLNFTQSPSEKPTRRHAKGPTGPSSSLLSAWSIGTKFLSASFGAGLNGPSDLTLTSRVGRRFGNIMLGSPCGLHAAPAIVTRLDILARSTTLGLAVLARVESASCAYSRKEVAREGPDGK
mmetsp:Transcript_32170/g.51809  ORF Transcript_32170/g.51809 Transcript_32170/m.51809 type:complete len:201 (-) Transcript_32170:8-610(-)